MSKSIAWCFHLRVAVYNSVAYVCVLHDGARFDFFPTDSILEARIVLPKSIQIVLVSEGILLEFVFLQYMFP